MRKVILDLAVTLDGFIEGPNGEIDWCIMDEEMAFEQFLSWFTAKRKSYFLLLRQLPVVMYNILIAILKRK
ncbi:MAG: hypothetical protein K0R55_3767 [Sporomusa sp.]|jgi:dihydrofolate reductase|nr:hypothetical protein [Sporomusa sp.]MDF2928178.1 hypothetical protein [Anaerospora sp.]